MKYIKKLNIDFDNWNIIPININEQQIKKWHPIFYKFLIKNKLMNIYLKMFDKCRWKDRGDTFEEILYSHKNLPLSLIISYTLNFDCAKKIYNYIYLLDTEFQIFMRYNKNNEI